MFIPLLASAALISLSSFFAYKAAEHVVKKQYGEALFDASYYLRDLPTFAGFTALFASTYFSGYILLSSYTANVFLLCGVLLAAYYVIFRGVLLTVFANRFRSILRTRYGCTETIVFDGARSRYQGGGVPSYVAAHLQAQMETSSKVAAPIGFVWLIFIYGALQYVPYVWIKGLVASGLVSLYCSIFSTFALLPASNDESSSKWRASPYSSSIPVVVFLVLFTFLTPLTTSPAFRVFN
mmetsp:Transcript_21739/g.27692  ORF Transcript_21739/g.27692 Transcript_21739/m.27692 type:complete len:238 (-) Transcript_21739:50-763(-)